MLKKMVLTVSFILLIPTLIFAQFNMKGFKDASQQKNDMLYKAQYDDELYVEDTVRYDYVKSPAKAFLLSAVIPGAGELYTGHWARAAAFMGMEALFWSMHFVKKGEGYDLEDEYKADADEQWDLDSWLGFAIDAGIEGLGPDGSHSISGILEVYENGEWVPKEDTYIELKIDDQGDFSSIADLNNEIEGYKSEYSSQNTRFVPVRTRDYYENIGKYYQFVAGWSDFTESSIQYDEEDSETVVGAKTKLRSKYINKRKDSNDALKMATNFSTAIIVNHVISAFHAQIMAKHYKPDDVTWNFNLLSDVREKYLFNGINFSVNFKGI